MKKMTLHQKRENLLGYTFLAPWLIGFFVFTAWPFIYTIYLSFHHVTLTVRGWEAVWNQFDNYYSALLRNTAFVPALIGFMGYVAMYLPVIIIIAFILALMLNQPLKFRAGFRLIYFLPVIIMSGSVMQQLMASGSTQLASIEGTLIYKVINTFSPFIAGGIAFLFDNFTMVLWFTGIPIVLFVNGLQKINPSLYEAAKIDGASSWQMLWKITMPLIKPIVLVASIFTLVQLGMYNLNPVYQMIQETIYNTAGGLGLASTFSWVYTLVVMGFVALIFMVLKDKGGDPS